MYSEIPQKHTIRPKRVPFKLATVLFVSTFNLPMWAIKPDVKWITWNFPSD